MQISDEPPPGRIYGSVDEHGLFTIQGLNPLTRYMSTMTHDENGKVLSGYVDPVPDDEVRNLP